MALDKFKNAVILYAVLPNMQLVAESLGRDRQQKNLSDYGWQQKELRGMYLEIKEEEVLQGMVFLKESLTADFIFIS